MSLDAPHPLLNEQATSAPRSGQIGVLPVEAAEFDAAEQVVPLTLAVTCPNCRNYGLVRGEGDEFRHVTRLAAPTFACSVCSWGPRRVADSPQQWRTWYGGRFGGTLVWAVNEAHLTTLIRYLETSPNRRGDVEFDWEYRRLMLRLPLEVTSGRSRNDVVSLLKKLQRTKPRDV